MKGGYWKSGKGENQIGRNYGKVLVGCKGWPPYGWMVLGVENQGENDATRSDVVVRSS